MTEPLECGRCAATTPDVRDHLVDQHRELRQDGMSVVGERYAVVPRCDACMERLRRMAQPTSPRGEAR